MLRSWQLASRLMRWGAGSYLFCLSETFEGAGGFDERFYASEELHFSRALRRWGAPRGLRFAILDGPVVTSSRKLRWFSAGQLAAFSVRMLSDPKRLFARDGCGLWYERPEGGRHPPHS